MNVVNGDLLDMAENGDFDIVIHGCNCFSKMGKGIALSIKNKWPSVYLADSDYPLMPSDRLGNYSLAHVSSELILINAYTQYTWRGKRGTVNADYDAIRSCFRRIKHGFSGMRIAYPLIGAGLAGGDWGIISQIINEELKDENHTLVILGDK